MNQKQFFALFLGLIIGVVGTYCGFRYVPAGSFFFLGHNEPADHDHSEHDGEEESEEDDADHDKSVIEADAARGAGIATEAAGPETLSETVTVYGQVKLNGDKIARVIPRFGGSILEVRKDLGDMVKSGEVLARVEANQSLVALDVKSPIDGIIVERNAIAGETVEDGVSLYTVVDLSNVWVELMVPQIDQGKIKTGQSVSVSAESGKPVASGTISWISPLGNAGTQSMVARVVLSNGNGEWRPGVFVKAAILINETEVPVAVKASAIQMFEGHPVVFVNEGNTYTARQVTFGRKGNGFVEVVDGLKSGENYVSQNSFIIKADMGKSEAGHEH